MCRRKASPILSREELYTQRWGTTTGHSQDFHNHPMAGHPGELEMYNSIWQYYWWPGLRTYIKNYVQGCRMCQQFKIDQQPTKPSFLPTEGASTTWPFANCSMDFITNLPPVKGYSSILVVVNQGLTKDLNLIPCSKTITAEETAQLLLENLYKYFGLLDKIISDWGPQFSSRTFVELLKLLGVKLSLSTAYYPQTDGTTEWVNQEIEVYLAIYCASHPEELLMALHTLEFTLPITIVDMQIDKKLLSSWCLGIHHKPFHIPSKTRGFPQ